MNASTSTSDYTKSGPSGSGFKGKEKPTEVRISNIAAAKCNFKIDFMKCFLINYM